jgi:hypothetical protein
MSRGFVPIPCTGRHGARKVRRQWSSALAGRQSISAAFAVNARGAFWYCTYHGALRCMTATAPSTQPIWLDARHSGVHEMPTRPMLHGDNGASLKATTVLVMLHWPGISPSYSRPRVSDDNTFAEALFRTAKYRPEFLLKGFAGLIAARQWAMQFMQWYNHEHRHSGIRYVTPAQRHAGRDLRLLKARHAAYQTARQRTPDAGVGIPATGRRSVSSRSIRSATLMFRRRAAKYGFPVR